ncbi:WD40/YVTN/BNR-like repeat-containing protein [Marinobacter sp. F4216]|uniref:WD40/YVTN/BNR-like repeat-containing protein n=1 Tax=Marinobacter sp. F4216 TaxID=2874281 RepID=UPI001CBC2473|nr:YCF48-related protein [Marinobacter sp. F4216]MBZ2168378.1 hypothetical protein [Marinobacter sp. F4216]
MNKRTLCTCLAGILTLPISILASAETLPDRLERPASQSHRVTSKLFTDLVTVGGKAIAVGADGSVLTVTSEDNYQQAEVPVDLLLTAVDFVDDTLGWAVGHDGALLMTTNGGRSWTKELDGIAIGELMRASAEEKVTRLEQATEENPDDADLALKLEDAIFKLEDIEAGMEYGPALPLMDIEFIDESTGFAVGAYGMAVETRDGGQSWQYIAGIDNPYSFHLNAVFSPAPGVVLVAGENGLLFRSMDKGTTWEPPREVGFSSLYNFVPGSGAEVLALGFGGTLFVSRDQGETWDQLDTGSSDTLFGGTSLSNGGVLLAQRGGLLYSEDLQEFKHWPAPGRSLWMDVVEPTAGQLILGGQAGIKTLSLNDVLGGVE